MAENTAAKADIGDPVVAMKATAAEDTSADTLTYDLLSGADAASFDIESTTGQLKTKAALDYETKASYMVTVTVTDGKDAEDNFDPAVDDTIMVTITVTPVNEAPVFPDTIAPIEVAEDTVAGVNIGVPVVAMDVDKGDTLTYMLDNTHAAFFAIDSMTGQLKTADPLANPLDYETQTDYEVMVTATDGPLSDTITVTINVTDVSVANGDDPVANREPVFNDGPSTTRSVAENTKAKANIGAPVAAMDVDRGDTLTYTLGDTHRAFFAIDSTTGQLKTADPLANPLDHETGDEYIVTVSVTDGRDDAGTVDVNAVADDTIRVTITVTDVNEAPAFDPETATRMVDENTAAGANIGAPGGSDGC